MAAIALIVGAVLVIVGAFLIDWPFGLIATGVLTLVGGADLTRRET